MPGKTPNKKPVRGERTPSGGRRRLKPARPDAKAVDVANGFESYEAAMAYLDARINVERLRPEKVDPKTLRLDRMRAILEKLGDPHKATRFVHVAGSKGKGSVCEMTASCLRACGYATGLYTSPHLVDLRERIRINGDLISHAAFTAVLAKVAIASEAVAKKHGDATYFEILSAAAFQHFADKAVDVAVIEVGLGGRLDSTNVIAPEVCAITAIQREHPQILGDTVELIAREKAGIMKPGIPVVTISQTVGVMEVFRQAAGAMGAPLSVVGQNLEFTYRFESSTELGPHARVCLTTPRSAYEHLAVPLKGEHQAINCGLALAILDALRERGFKTPEQQVSEGLSKTPLNGRMERVWRDPRIIVDGAHNPESIAALVKAIGGSIKFDSMVVIFGCASDKDVPQMLTNIARGADKIIFTAASDNTRAMDPRDLQRRFAEVSPKMAQIAPNVKDALNIAARAVGRDDLICVTGSFHLAGEAKRLLLERAAKDAASAKADARAGSKAESRVDDPRAIEPKPPAKSRK